MRNLIFFSLITILLNTSCNQSNTADSQSATDYSGRIADSKEQGADTNKLRYGGIDTAQVSKWLTGSILKEDIAFLTNEQRNYQLDAYDLNNDGKPEYFIGLTNDYFCGSGGCTYYLVDHQGNVISLFTVSRAPFYVLSTQTNGWADLVINSNSGLRKLSFDGASYPTNPSILPAFDDSIQYVDTTTVLENTETYSF